MAERRLYLVRLADRNYMDHLTYLVSAQSPFSAARIAMEHDKLQVADYDNEVQVWDLAISPYVTDRVIEWGDAYKIDLMRALG